MPYKNVQQGLSLADAVSAGKEELLNSPIILIPFTSGFAHSILDNIDTEIFVTGR